MKRKMILDYLKETTIKLLKRILEKRKSQKKESKTISFIETPFLSTLCETIEKKYEKFSF
jgi:hypothetical protein